MKYEDSLIPRRCSQTLSANTLETAEQVLLMKIDNGNSVGELRRKLRLIERFDFRLQTLVDKGYVQFDSPTAVPKMLPLNDSVPARVANPLPTTARQADELNRVLEALAAEKSQGQAMARTAEQAPPEDVQMSAAERAAYGSVKEELSKQLAQDADDLAAAGLLFALENSEDIGAFRRHLRLQIDAAELDEKRLYKAFENHFEEMIQSCQQKPARAMPSADSSPGPRGLTIKDLDELA